jgi:hypothetical protein
LAIVLSVLLQFTESDYPFGIFKFFLRKEPQEAISVYLFPVGSNCVPVLDVFLYSYVADFTQKRIKDSITTEAKVSCMSYR